MATQVNVETQLPQDANQPIPGLPGADTTEKLLSAATDAFKHLHKNGLLEHAHHNSLETMCKVYNLSHQ
eukprot:Awhi_evm1s13451